MARPSPDSPTLLEIAEPPSDRFEKRARKRGARLIAGVDEAGRGPLAGPVVVAAVVFEGRVSEGARRFQAADRERARTPLRPDPRQGHRLGGGREPRADRPDEHPAGHPLGDEPGGRRTCRAPRPRARRRQHAAAGPRLSGRGGDRRRWPVGLDRRGLDRRQGDARPADGRGRPRLPGLRLRAATWAIRRRSISRR